MIKRIASCNPFYLPSPKTNSLIRFLFLTEYALFGLMLFGIHKTTGDSIKYGICCKVVLYKPNAMFLYCPAGVSLL
jgi:hypothetical protein